MTELSLPGCVQARGDGESPHAKQADAPLLSFPATSGADCPRYRMNERPCLKEIRVVPWSVCFTPESGRDFLLY